MKRLNKFKYKILVPNTPDWIKRADDPRSISIHDIPITTLRKLGKAWINNLIQLKEKGINAKFIKSV